MSVLPRQPARDMTVPMTWGGTPRATVAIMAAALFQRARPYLAAALISTFLTGSFFSVCRPMEIVRMPSW